MYFSYLILNFINISQRLGLVEYKWQIMSRIKSEKKKSEKMVQHLGTVALRPRQEPPPVEIPAKPPDKFLSFYYLVFPLFFLFFVLFFNTIPYCNMKLSDVFLRPSLRSCSLTAPLQFLLVFDAEIRSFFTFAPNSCLRHISCDHASRPFFLLPTRRCDHNQGVNRARIFNQHIDGSDPWLPTLQLYP